jgi:hypothetical protein
MLYTPEEFFEWVEDNNIIFNFKMCRINVYRCNDCGVLFMTAGKGNHGLCWRHGWHHNERGEVI